MDYNSFITHITKLKKQTLGGEESQFKLAPALRKNLSNAHIDKLNPREAAVVSLFYPNQFEKIQFLLMLRADYNGAHSAQISFPGGKKELHDPTLYHTALREAREEMNIDEEKVSLIRALTPTYVPPSNFRVYPFLCYLEETPKLVPNNEVAAIIEVPLSDLLSDSVLINKRLTTSYMKEVEVPCFKLNGYTVWGATAMILSEIKDLFHSVL
ncbi:CoA pyrophosphatase [Flavobacteriaceae bacterium F08102]|nr:CoA pyrophosphatase [Flavobacteriaceae bacterium F08102]